MNCTTPISLCISVYTKLYFGSCVDVDGPENVISNHALYINTYKLYSKMEVYSSVWSCDHVTSVWSCDHAVKILYP